MVKHILKHITRYMSHENYIEHVQIESLIFFVKIVVRRFAGHIFHTFNKKGRQVKPKRRQSFRERLGFWACIYKKNQHLHFLVHGHSSWSTFGLHLVRGPRLSKLKFYEVRPWNSDHELGPLTKAIFHGLTSWSIV